MRKTLIVRCPHITDKDASGTPTIVVEGGPLTLAMDLTIVEGSIAQLVNEETLALRALYAWMAQPGVGEVVLSAHAHCECEFLRSLDAEETKERVDALAHELHETILGNPKVSVRIVDESSTAQTPRHQSGATFISSPETAEMDEAVRQSA